MPQELSVTSVPGRIRIGLICTSLALLVIAGVVILYRVSNGSRKESTEPDRSETRPMSAGHSYRPRSLAAAERLDILDAIALAPGTTNLTTAQLLAQLLDESVSLSARRQAARALAQIESDEALAALKQILASGPPYLKAAIAEGLGQSPHPESHTLLLDLVNGPDVIAARGAARGLALRGDADSVQTLADVLFNEQRAVSVRAEAALSLGAAQFSGAQESLVRALGEIRDETIVDSVLEGLGRRPFADTQEIFRNYLDSKIVSTESKISALEALHETDGNVAPFLLKYLADGNPDIRAAAAWALSAAGNDLNGVSSETGAQVLAVLTREPEANVRARLYEVLAEQNNVDATAILGLVRTESDVNARLAGLTCLAGTLQSPSAFDVALFFEQIAVPELKNMALQANDPESRLLSVIVLRRAKTPGSLTALQSIAATSRDPKIIQAAQAAVRAPVRQ